MLLRVAKSLASIIRFRHRIRIAVSRDTDWVGPGGVTLVVDTTVLVDDVVDAVAEVGAATQYESLTYRNWQFELIIFFG